MPMYTLIGGKSDGIQVDIELDLPRVQIPVYKELDISDLDPAAKTELETYERHTIKVDEEMSYELYAIQGSDFASIIGALVKGYRKP